MKPQKKLGTEVNKVDETERSSLMFSHRDNICTILYRVAHLCELKQNRILKAYGLTHQQTQILAYIVARQEQVVLQRDIEEEMFLKSSTVTEQLHILERKGLIKRSPCREDRRAKQLSATEKAVEMHQVFLDSIIQVDACACAGMSEIEQVALKKLLLELYDNVRNAQ